jgi:hypothetical protein
MNWHTNVAQATALAAILAAGCAANGPAEAPETTIEAQGVATTQEPAVEFATPVQSASPPPTPADGDGVIEALPAAQPMATPVAAQTPSPQAVMVCSYERRTGSNRKVKICRKPQTALDRDETQRTFDSLRRSQMGEPR